VSGGEGVYQGPDGLLFEAEWTRFDNGELICEVQVYRLNPMWRDRDIERVKQHGTRDMHYTTKILKIEDTYCTARIW
jgi:hypothetical protein